MVRVGVEWVNSFSGPCSQPNLAYCDDTSVGFLNGMTSRGHAAAFNFGDGNAWETDFRDTSFGGADSTWIDNVDFAHFSSHGSTGSNNVFRGYFGVARQNCTWASSQARYGRLLKWLAIDACQSLELSRNIITVWQNTFQGLHMILAFTSLVSDSSWTAGRGYNFGRRAGNGERLTTSWLDECYSYWCDDNPVTMAAGRNSGDAFNRRDNDRVNAGFDNIPGSQVTYFAWMWRS